MLKDGEGEDGQKWLDCVTKDVGIKEKAVNDDVTNDRKNGTKRTLSPEIDIGYGRKKAKRM